MCSVCIAINFHFSLFSKTWRLRACKTPLARLVAIASPWRHRASLCAGLRKLSQAEQVEKQVVQSTRDSTESPNGASFQIFVHSKSQGILTKSWNHRVKSEITEVYPENQRNLYMFSEIREIQWNPVKSSEISDEIWNPVKSGEIQCMKSLTKSEITLEILKSFVYLEDFEISYASSPSGKPLEWLYVVRGEAPDNFMGVASECPLFRGKNVRESAVRTRKVSAVGSLEVVASRR